MRITEARISQLNAKSIADNRSRLSESQQQMVSGTRVERPSQDVSAWARGQRARVRSAISEGRGKAVSAARERLEATAQVFDGLGSILRRARELAVAAANDTLAGDDRARIGQEVEQLREQALGLSNARGIDSEYLLAGTISGPAFDAAGVYVGDGQVSQIEAGEGLRQTVGVTGTTLTVNDGVDVLIALEDFANALESNDAPGIQTSIGEMATATDQVASAYSQVGMHMQALDSADENREQLELSLLEVAGRALDADPIETASTLARNATALQTAQAIGQQISALFQG